MTNQELEKFLQASKRRFNEHLERKYPGIGKFNASKYTKELSKYIPLDCLENLVKHYRLFAEVTRKPKNPGRKSSNDPMNFPSDEMSEIEAILKNLKKRKWLQDIADIDEVMWVLNAKMFQSPQGWMLKIEQQKSQYRGKKGGRWENYALKFILYFLVQYAREVKSRPCYKEITNFLEEQHILKPLTEATYTQKFCTNIKPMKIKNLYMLLMMNFESDWFDRWAQANETQHLKYEVQSYCLPDFDDFYPPNRKNKYLPNTTTPFS